MNKQRTYIAILSFMIIAFIVFELTKPKPLNLRDSFTQYDTIPLGTYILYHELPVLFPEKDIFVNEVPVFETDYFYDYESGDSYSEGNLENWIFINNVFSLDKWETELLLDQVHDGGHAFIAARQFGGYFADSLNLETTLLPYYFTKLTGDNPGEASVSFDTSSTTKSWNINARFLESAFISYDSTRTTELGYIENEDLNFIKVTHGEGVLYLHTTPELFTNYIVRDTAYTDYTFKVLSNLPVVDTYWDEYYKAGRDYIRSPMRVIISEEYLKWAWVLAIVAVLLFFIFRSKRVQRTIPLLQPPKNTSIQFASTVAQLYLEKKSHKDIAAKKIKFFLGYLRNNVHVDTSELTEELASTIAARTGIVEEKINNLFQAIELYTSQQKISESDLKNLTDRIDQFYKNSSR